MKYSDLIYPRESEFLHEAREGMFFPFVVEIKTTLSQSTKR